MIMSWFRALIILIRRGPFITTNRWNANELTMFANQPLRNGHPTLHIAITPNSPLDVMFTYYYNSSTRWKFRNLLRPKLIHTRLTTLNLSMTLLNLSQIIHQCLLILMSLLSCISKAIEKCINTPKQKYWWNSRTGLHKPQLYKIKSHLILM